MEARSTNARTGEPRDAADVVGAAAATAACLCFFPSGRGSRRSREEAKNLGLHRGGGGLGANGNRQVMPGKKNPKRERERNSVKRGCLSAFSQQGEATVHGFPPLPLPCFAPRILHAWCVVVLQRRLCTSTGHAQGGHTTNLAGIWVEKKESKMSGGAEKLRLLYCTTQ
jgi:hypothetical protein